MLRFFLARITEVVRAQAVAAAQEGIRLADLDLVQQLETGCKADRPTVIQVPAPSLPAASEGEATSPKAALEPAKKRGRPRKLEELP